MNGLPTGTVTFLFTDIEGSTKLAQQYPEAMLALLARHHEILHQASQAHNGYVFQVVADSFAIAFHSAGDAVNAALDAQRSLHAEAWSPAPIKVRMGIHTGAAQLNDASAPIVYSSYATIAATQRIMSAGHGGQIILSGTTRELVRDTLPVHSELVDLGEKRLKDLMRAEHLYQLNTEGLPFTFPPLKTLDSYLNNLPTQLTSFIGRETEITEVKHELEQHRLVTLTGSGGTGKTRLALQVAAELFERFKHGTWFVELAPLTDPELIPQSILSSIGVSEQQERHPLEILKEYLNGKRTLIILDNCEHLISASAQVADTLLNAAPDLKILASSREALGLKGEVSFHVPSLKLPDPKHPPAVEQLSQYEAVRLFIDRALLVAPHFMVDQDNGSSVAQICSRLDGIPLAIELAAARVKMLSVEQISKRLDDRFRLLTGGARTVLPRQQTLRALIDWSYDLLTEQEALLLRRLSIFAGSWTLESAEEVCAGDGIKTYDVLDLLSQLINKSLVIVIEDSQSGETRYRMLETIRQYAREKFVDAGGSESIRDKHLAYFVRLVEQAEPELYRSNQIFWFNKLDDEIDNLRMAMEWAQTGDVRSGLKIAVLPWHFWDMRYFREYVNWLRQLVNEYKFTDPLYCQALALYSFKVFRYGEIALAFKLAEESLQLARSLSAKREEAFSLFALGCHNGLQGNLKEAVNLGEQSLAIYRSLDDKHGQVMVLETVSRALDVSKGIDYAREALQLDRELGNLVGIATTLISLSRLTLLSGDFSSPAAWLDEALSIARTLGDQGNEIYVLNTLGQLAYYQGDYQRAIAYLEESLTLSEQSMRPYYKRWARVYLGYAFLGKGAIIQAKEAFILGIQLTQKANVLDLMAYAVEGLASICRNQNLLEQAVELFAWSDKLREQMVNPRLPVEQAAVDRDLTVIHSQIDDENFARLSAEGRALTTEQAIALALGE